MSFDHTCRMLISLSAVGLYGVLATPVAVAEGEDTSEKKTSIESAGQGSSVEEVVVTARKREESLSDTSASISASSGADLREAVVNDVRDLQYSMPELTIGEVIGIMKINMRGMGNSTNTRSEDPDVVLHEDGAVIARMEAQSMSFFDLERVEVLRGPQGTLYGRNSTGGTINLVTAKPTHEFTGYLNTTVGNYDFVKFEGAVGGPLTNSIRARAAIQSISRNGFGENIGSGNDMDDDHRWAGRLHVLFDLSDRANLLLTGEHASQNDASGQFSYLSSQFPTNPDFVPRGAGGFSDPDSRDGSYSTDPQLQRETNSLTATLNWDWSEQLTFRSIVNGRTLDFFLVQDLDQSTVDSGATITSVPLEDSQASGELQLLYDSPKFNAITGLFYYTETFEGATNVGTSPTEGFSQILLGRSETSAAAAFWSGTYHLTDHIALRAGGRYNTEKREIVNDRIVNGMLASTDNDISDDERTFKKYTGEYGADLRINDDSLLYYTYSQGVRSGAALIFQSGSPILDPTTVDAHELGFKFQSAGGRFSAAVAVYQNDIKDLQRTQAAVDEQGRLITAVNNVDAMEVSGVEIQASLRATDRFRLDVGASHIDGEYKDFVTDDPLIQGNNPIQVAGNKPSFAPDWKGNFGAQYDIPVRNGAAILETRVGLTYVGAQFFDEFNRAPFDEEAYTLVDASMTYRPMAESWSVSLWGKNLGDEKEINATSFSAFGQVTNKSFISPLTYGLQVNFNF